tara:strand:+ start:128 stop:436 length:309 start_codon:yes stop_codon:yes gene_type:complete
MSKSPDTKWNVVASGETKAMGSSDEVWGISDYVGAAMSKIGAAILSGYDPAMNESISNNIAEALKTKDVIIYRNPSRTTEVVFHKVREGMDQIQWSVRQKGN